MKNLLFVITIFLISTSSYARYKVLTCDNKHDAYSCSGSCKVDGYEVKFKIDKLKNIVIQSNFLNNELVSQNIGENCKVVDEKNWTCESENTFETLNPKVPVYIRKSGMGMNEGQFFSYWEDNLLSKNHNHGTCAKKSLF
jgi:hypothetical protein